MSKFIFKEDRSDTGHGWRDLSHKLFVDDNENIIAEITDEDCDFGKRYFAEYSYAWICPKAYYDAEKCIADNIRKKDILAHHPNFLGNSDMESHFEFRMSPKEMRKYLIDLGFTEIKR